MSAPSNAKPRWGRMPSKAAWPEYWPRISTIYNGHVLHVTRRHEGFFARIWKNGYDRTDERDLGEFPTCKEAKAACERAALEYQP